MYLDYLKERYKPGDFAPITLEQIASEFETLYHEKGAMIFKGPFGFITYTMKGDALIIFDLYIKPEARRLHVATSVEKALIEHARKHEKRVVITFTDEVGQNQYLGLFAIKSAGYVPAHQLTNSQMYIKGI